MKYSLSPFTFILNKLTYVQTYILLGFLFSLTPLIISYFWTSSHLQIIGLYDRQQDLRKQEDLLMKLTNQLQQRRRLSIHPLIERMNLKTNLQALDAQINQTWQALETIQKKIESLEDSQNTIQSMQNQWDSLKQQGMTLPAEINEELHNDLIRQLLIEMSYLDKESLILSGNNPHFKMTLIFIIRLPSLLEDLSKLTLLSEKAGLRNLSSSREEILNRAALIKANARFLKEVFESQKGSQSENQALNPLIAELNDYFKSIEDFLKPIEKELLSSQTPTIHADEIESSSEIVANLTNKIWELNLRDLHTFYLNERNHILKRMLIVLFFTMAYTIIVFLIGFLITKKITSRLLNLTEATNDFTNGNLSVRVPVLNYHDEVGKQAEAFNRMAEKLEEIINSLYELLDATTALSNGDLSARIKVKNNNTEFDQVAKSFNKMAENFESIIGQTQQIGLILSNSASEIATASKEQEIVIVEQEATTREIAITANEISSTAKEFATTVNEINTVAEQTAGLALKGKDSLNKMEAIMRQMVDASSNIASKLAVLNEKASNITSMITTITKVADQTNLLSLNASIEAEKAGEYGRSFSVIAREIRRLADQTAVSTLDIEKMVNEIMVAVSSSVMGVDDFTQEIRNGVEQLQRVSGQLTAIIEQVQAFTGRFELVNQGMQTQSTGAEQINESISQLSQTAQQTTESIHQFHKTIQELNKAANALRTFSPFLKVFSNSGSEKTSHYYLSSSKTHEEGIPEKGDESSMEQTLSSLNLATSKLKKRGSLNPSSPNREEK